MSQPIRLIALLVTCAAASACVYTPREVAYYDEQCQGYEKKYVLEKQPFSAFNGDGAECENEACLGIILLKGTVTALAAPVTALASGAVAATGNATNWVERRGECAARSAPVS